MVGTDKKKYPPEKCALSSQRTGNVWLSNTESFETIAALFQTNSPEKYAVLLPLHQQRPTGKSNLHFCQAIIKCVNSLYHHHPHAPPQEWCQRKLIGKFRTNQCLLAMKPAFSHMMSVETTRY